jgi:hypothetical protein
MTLIWEIELVLLALLSDVTGNRTGAAPPQSMPQAASKFHLCSSSRLLTSLPMLQVKQESMQIVVFNRGLSGAGDIQQHAPKLHEITYCMLTRESIWTSSAGQECQGNTNVMTNQPVTLQAQLGDRAALQDMIGSLLVD